MLKAVILIGGPQKGTRFRPLSLDIPKPLFPIAGLPLIEHHIAACTKLEECKEILIIGSYNTTVMVQFVTEMQKEYQVIIRYLQEFSPLGTGGALYHFRDQVRAGNPSAFFLLNGDVCADFPLRELWKFHEERPNALITIMGTEATRQQSVHYGCMVVESGTKAVTHYVEKPSSYVSTLINCGVYVCATSLLHTISDYFINKQHLFNGNGHNTPGYMSWEQDVLALLAGTGKLYALQVTNWWSQVKTAGSALYANRHYLQLRRPPLPPLAPTANLRPDVYVHHTANVHETAVIGPNVSIGAGVSVCAGVRVKESIILNNATIKEHALVMYSVVGQDAIVGEWSRVEGTPSDPDPNKPFAKMDNRPLFNQDGRLNPSITILVTIPLLSFGMVQGWLSPMIASLQSPSGPSAEPYTTAEISWAASVTYITAIVCGAPMGWLTDKYGRKMMTLATTLSLIVYWQIKLFCLSPWALILARAVAGIPCSACYIVLPIYLKEISDIDLRAAVGSLLIMNRNIGYLASYVGADLLPVNTMLWLGLAVPTVVFFIFLAMPETPEFLVKQGKIEEAKSVLAWLRGVTVVDRSLQAEVEAIVRVEKQTQADSKSAWNIILHDQPTLKAFIITLIIKITQQFDGYLIVLIYAGLVFQRASEFISLELSPNKQVMMIGVVQLVGSIVSTSVIEKTGRKFLLVSTSFAVGLGMLVLSAWFYLTSAGTWLPGWVPVLAMCVCIFADAAGFQPISYIIITDLFTFQLRGTVSSFTNIFAKLSNFIQMKWFSNLNELIGIHFTFLFFSLVCFFACFYTVAVVPETRQKSVPEIYEKLTKKPKDVEARNDEVPQSL